MLANVFELTNASFSTVDHYLILVNFGLYTSTFDNALALSMYPRICSSFEFFTEGNGADASISLSAHHVCSETHDSRRPCHSLFSACLSRWNLPKINQLSFDKQTNRQKSISSQIEILSNTTMINPKTIDHLQTD